MNQEFFDALLLLEKEKGIPTDYLLEKIKNAIVIAVKRDYGNVENVIADFDMQNKLFYVAIRKLVVEEVEDPANELPLAEAQRYDEAAEVGGYVDLPLETKQFGRIAAQTAKHVIKQGIREAERSQMLAEFQNRQHEIVRCV